jgi:hypothetical protein
METMTFGGRQTTMRIASFSPEMQAEEQFRREVAQWFFAAVQCRVNIVQLDDAPESQDLNRRFLASLIGWGEWAEQQARNMNIDLSPIGVTVDDVAAETRILRMTHRSAFENVFSTEEAEAVLKEVFG